MATGNSPLRYPGGKQVLAKVLAHLIRINAASEGVYAEPFAGGAGAALALLFGEHVERIIINDADCRIAAFWEAVLHQTNAFIKLVQNTPVTIAEWRRQRAIYLDTRRRSTLAAGFATFYLNRCNRSGIIASGGPIGGIRQQGQWKIDARFNRDNLSERVSKIATYRDRIELSNLDAIKFLRLQSKKKRPKARPLFVYLDPPYFAMGEHLYLNYYDADDHGRLAKYLKGATAFQWALTYDNVPQIKKLYAELRRAKFDLAYSARERKTMERAQAWKPRMDASSSNYCCRRQTITLYASTSAALRVETYVNGRLHVLAAWQVSAHRASNAFS